MSRLHWWLSSSMVLLLASVSTAHADIRSPQDHSDIEAQPHLVLQWQDEPGWHDEGLGLGFHVAIPVIPRGPITTINNSLAIGFGLDWAHFDDTCGPYGVNFDDDCSAEDFWIPVYVQWNFFLSDLISVFPELGMAIEYETWDGVQCSPGNNRYWCGDDESDIDPELVLWLGVRFHLSEAIAITLKLGRPSLLLGVSFFL